jgi:Microsomal signal peptidase 12 kDa subunit (SPC12)
VQIPPPIPLQLVGFIHGYLVQSFQITFYYWAASVAISLILCVPDWPFFNRNPIQFLDSLPPVDMAALRADAGLPPTEPRPTVGSASTKKHR